MPVELQPVTPVKMMFNGAEGSHSFMANLAESSIEERVSSSLIGPSKTRDAGFTCMCIDPTLFACQINVCTVAIGILP